MPTTSVDRTVKLAQPALAVCGLLVTSVVAVLVPAVAFRLIESIDPVPEVTLFPDASRTQTVIDDVETPLAGIGFGVNFGDPRFAAAPKPVKEAVPVAVPPEKLVDEATASQVSALALLIVNFTVEPVAPAVEAVSGFAGNGPTLVGVVDWTFAVQSVVVPVWFRVRVTGVAVKTGLPDASWTWTVIAHVEDGVFAVVSVLVHVFAVIASLDAGPAADTVAVLVPDVRPVDAAVTMQEPGTPVIVSVLVIEEELAKTVVEVGEMLQTLPLSTDHVTIRSVVVFVSMPFASRSFAVAVVVVPAPDGKADWPSDTVICVGAPGAVKTTFVVQPVRLGNVGDAAESWSVPVLADEAGAVRVKVATPLTRVLVAEASAPLPRSPPKPPACERVTVLVLSPVRVLPRESCSDTVIVEVAPTPEAFVPAPIEDGFAAQASFAAAPTLGT